MEYCDDYNETYYEPSDLDLILNDYKEKCKDILLSSIQNEINSLIENNKSLEERNKELRNEVRNLDKLKQDFERDKNKYIRDGIENYQREALGGLRCGDKVYTFKTETIYENCEYCNGTHKVEAEIAGIKKTVDCPHCGYNGKKEIDIVCTPQERIISQITTSMWHNNKMFRRYLYMEKEKGCADNASDEYICDNHDGDNRDARETNYTYENVLDRDFWLSEEDCLSACEEYKNKWMEKRANKI